MLSGFPDYQAFDIPVPVPSGGTGLGALTLNGVLVGKATDALKVSDAGASNQVFRVPAAGGEPAFGQIDLAAVALTLDGCGVYNSVAESIASGAAVPLTFNGEYYNNGGLHSTVTNTSRLTAQKAGKYLITGQINWASSGTNRFLSVQIRKGGSVYLADLDVWFTYTSGPRQNISILAHLDASEYVELLVGQNTGGALNCSGPSSAPWFAMQWLGP